MSNDKNFSLGGFLKKGVLIILILGAILIGLTFNSVMEYIDNDEYAIHQSAFTGKLTVWNDAGWHKQLFGKVTKYKKAGDIYLSSDELDGGKGAAVQPVEVLFPDGNAKVDVVARYELSLTEDIQKEIYMKYSTEESIKSMIRQQILEGMKQVGPLMSSSEAYSYRKHEVASLGRAMALEGIYASEVIVDTTKDTDGNNILVKRYNVKRDSMGLPIVTKESILKTYNIALPVYNVKDMDFDAKTVKLIEARKDAQLSKQAKITAFQEGEAMIARERATQEVQKIKEVTIAEKEAEVAVLNAEREKDVAILNAEKAEQIALKTIREAKAEADANALKVKAGLTPQERAEWAYKTHVDGQKAMFGPGIGSWDLPDVMTGGGSDGGFMNALSVNQLLEIQKKMSTKK